MPIASPVGGTLSFVKERVIADPLLCFEKRVIADSEMLGPTTYGYYYHPAEILPELRRQAHGGPVGETMSSQRWIGLLVPARDAILLLGQAGVCAAGTAHHFCLDVSCIPAMPTWSSLWCVICHHSMLDCC
jgi:hypothetical protein